MEVLSRMLTKAQEEGRIKGMRLSRGGPSITHLLFADDLLLFGQATASEIDELMECIKKFCDWSGQSINLNKSQVHFSKNLHFNITSSLSSHIGLSRMNRDTTYLGIPILPTNNMTKTFKPLVDRISSKLSGWKCSTLSKAGRATLIKSVGQSIPIYPMMTNALTSKTLTAIDSTLLRFWWGAKQGKKAFTPKSWKKVCTHKSQGGLGFKLMEPTNIALLAKWPWNFLNNPDAPWVKIISAKYLRRHPPLSASCKKGDSRFWKAFTKSAQIIKNGACYQLGTGNSINIWRDPWIPSLPNFRPTPTTQETTWPCLVSHFINNDHNWNIPLLSKHFSPCDVQIITHVTIPPSDPPDRWIWTPNKNGKFTTKSAYKLAANEDNTVSNALTTNNPHTSIEIWKKLWKSNINNRHKFLWWSILNNILPTKHFTARFGTNNNPLCPICHEEDETIPHLLFRCQLAKVIWRSSPWGLQSESFLPHNPNLWITHLIDNPLNLENNNMLIFASIAIDLTWKARNEIVHNCIPINIPSLCRSVNILLIIYSKALGKNSTKNNPTNTKNWSPPPTDWIKINYDAAVRSNFSYISYVARDERGTILRAASRRVSVTSPNVAEAEAAFFATSSAVFMGWRNCIFEGDSSTVGAALRDPISSADWEIYHTVDATFHLLRLFQFYDISTVCRTRNFIAHNIAKWAAISAFVGVILPHCLPDEVLLEEE